MAINKKLIHFEKGASFDRELAAGNILETSICWIKDRQQIYTHQWGLQGVPEGGLPDLILTIDEDGNLIWSDPAYYTKEEINDMLYYEDRSNGVEYINMGEAGIWTKYPIGVTNWENCYDDVLYFTWGGIQGYKASLVQSGEIRFDGSLDRFCGTPGYIYHGSNGMQYAATKYCNDSRYGKDGYTDGLTILEPEDDAAHTNLGGGWRMPTKEECQKLYEVCNTGWVTDYNGVNGLNGRLFKLKTDESKQLFFPATGYCSDSLLREINNCSALWLSSLCLYSSIDGDLMVCIPYLVIFSVNNRYQGKNIFGFMPAEIGEGCKFYTKKEVDKKFETTGSITLIDEYNNPIAAIPIFKSTDIPDAPPLGYGYYNATYLLGDWDEPTINIEN